MKILSIAATNHKGSMNKELLNYVASVFEDGKRIYSRNIALL